jgi:hypothetical protein
MYAATCRSRVLIWNSVPVLTLIDSVIVLITAASVGVIFMQRRALVDAGALKFTLLLLGGLVLIAVFYVADFWTMDRLSARTSPMEATRIIARLNAGLAP